MTETNPANPRGWALTCYGNQVAVFDTLDDEAIPAAGRHILGCPRSPMPWVTAVEWHSTTAPELGGTLVSASGGQWLNHHLTPLPSQDPHPGPPSLGALLGSTGRPYVGIRRAPAPAETSFP